MDLAIDKFDKRRFGLITGSVCSVMFPDKGNGEKGMSSYASELAIRKYFKYYDEISTWQMQHGCMNEHEAFTFYQNSYDFNLEKGLWKDVGEYGGTCDALSADYGVDFKCPTSLDGWLDYIFTGISKQQYNQCQMYMLLFDKPLWKVCAYLTETEWMIQRELSYPVPADKRIILVEVQRNLEWEERLIKNTPFVIEEREKYYQILCDQFGTPSTLIKEQVLITE